jgi:hypothetical protein
MGCCLAVLAVWLSPRFVLLLIWLFGDRLEVAFDSFLTGFVGFLILPWTTLAYALAYAPQDEVTGVGWLLVGLGLLFDLGAWFGGGRQSRTYYVERRGPA